MAFHCGIACYEVPSTLSGPTAPCGRLHGLYSLRQVCAAQSARTESNVQRGGLRLISPPQPTPETVILHSQPPGRRATPRTRICRRPSSPRARPSSRTDNLRRRCVAWSVLFMYIRWCTGGAPNSWAPSSSRSQFGHRQHAPGHALDPENLQGAPWHQTLPACDSRASTERSRRRAVERRETETHT